MAKKRHSPEEVVKILRDIEIEDLVGTKLVADTFSRLYHSSTAEYNFDEIFDPKKPIVDQMENFAKGNNIALPEGWKVVLSRQVKKRGLLPTSELQSEEKRLWLDLFTRLGVLDAQPAQSKKPIRDRDSEAAI